MARRHCAAVIVVAIAVLTAGLPDAATRADAIALTTRAYQPGELVIVTATLADPPPEQVSVTAFGTTAAAIGTGAHTWRAIMGIDLEQPPGPATIVVTALRDGTTTLVTESVVVHAKRFPTRRLRVRPQFVDPPPELAERIAAEATFLNELYATSAPEPLWRAPFVRPVDERANSSFGTRSVFNGKPRSPHAGADFASPRGTPVRAPNAGRIVAARDLFFSGQTVVIDHGQRLFSLLAHLSSMDVHEGEMVDAGARVGLVGATGRVTGPHLHWALRAAGARVDPLGALALLGAAE